MKTTQKNYLVVENINYKNIQYGFFTKNGGCSSKNFFSLNCNLNSNDNKNLVKKNIEIAKNNLGIKNKKIKFLKQIHSDKVEIINANNFKNLITGDGSITIDKNIALAILTADCAPIFIFDKKNTFICAIHAGWKGCLSNIIKKAIKKIVQLGVERDDLIALVGPCLEEKNFEVDKDFINIFKKKDINYLDFFSKKNGNNKFFFNMRSMINFQLKKCLISEVKNVNLDTYSNSKLFFSHRYCSHQGYITTGRMINLISFKETI